MPEKEFDTNQSDDRTTAQRVSALEFELRVEQGKINEFYARTTKVSERIDNAAIAFKKLDTEIRVLNEKVAEFTKLVEDMASKEAENAAARSTSIDKAGHDIGVRYKDQIVTRR